MQLLTLSLSKMSEHMSSIQQQDEDSGCSSASSGISSSCSSSCFHFPEMLTGDGHPMSIGQALVDVLRDAIVEHRVTRGFLNCGHLLQTNPGNVMLCVLAENGDMSRDVAYNIHTTLLEAFCLENDIWMIKVDSSRKLCSLLMPDDDAGHMTCMDDSPCLLVEFSPVDGVTMAEEDLISFCRLTSDISPQPIIELPA